MSNTVWTLARSYRGLDRVNSMKKGILNIRVRTDGKRIRCCRVLMPLHHLAKSGFLFAIDRRPGNGSPTATGRSPYEIAGRIREGTTRA